MHYKNDFPIFKQNKKLVYLDSAATTQKPQIAIDTVNRFFTKHNSNIHRGIYDLSIASENLYENTRHKIAALINSSNPSEIIFTGNTTESINLAALGYFEKFLKKGDIIVLSEMEHHSNIVPWLRLKNKLGISILYIPISKDFQLDIPAFLSLKIDFKKIKLISLTHASNILGTLNPLETIIPKLKTKCPNALVLIDAAQSIPHVKVDVVSMQCDFLAFSSHKLFGPSGVGVLWVKKKILDQMDPLFLGGHMIETVTKENATFALSPQKFEAGTGKLEGVVGLGASIDYLNKISIKGVKKYEDNLTNYALSKLSKINNLQIYGPKKNRLPVFSFNIGNIHPHDVSEILNREHICVRAGHHCSQVLMEVLHTPQGTVRASFSIYNTKDDIDKLINAIDKVKKIFKI